MQAVQEIEDEALRAEHDRLQRRLAFEKHFRTLAEGRPWYEGTGFDDPVLAHQWGGACYGAVAKRWLLADEPGAGKTRTSVGWLDLVGAEKVVLVAEANVANQFAGEAMTLAPHRTVINLAGLSKKTRHEHLNQMLKMREGVVVINYEIFRQDQEALGKIQMWQADSMIVDEAHNMKNPRSSNYQYVEAIAFAQNTCPSCGGLIFGVIQPCPTCGWWIPGGEVKAYQNKTVRDHALFFESRSLKNITLMTGTPILNTPVDLFTIYHLIDPVQFPHLAWFKKEFTHPDYSQKRSVFSRKGLEKLTPMLKGRFLQRTLKEVGIFLPKQHIHVERVELDPVKYPGQHRVIEQVSKHAAVQLLSGEKSTLMHVISIILRKRQANVWPGGVELTDDETGEKFSIGSEVTESAKMDAALEKIMAYHKEGRRQIVFSQFQTALEEFEKRIRLKNIRTARFDGTTSKKQREIIREDFKKADAKGYQFDVVLVHYRTGGAGLTLNGASVTHILDEEWNAGKRDQSYARDHRIGQTRETDVHVYRMPGVDTWMANLIAMKEKMVNSLGAAMSGEKQQALIIEAIKNGEI